MTIFKKLFNHNLEDEGERVDINYYRMNYNNFDMYQKSHYKRYEYARSLMQPTDVCGDFACGTGYGSMMIAEKALRVTGADINKKVIDIIEKRYRKNKKVNYFHSDLLELDFESVFDVIVSFETIEHFEEDNIRILLKIFNKALKPGGKFIFSTPYNQEKSELAMKMGFHFTYYIVEETIKQWLATAGFGIESMKYQNYQAHDIVDKLEKKDFIVCVAKKDG